MSESDDSAIPSTMDLQDLLQMATSNPETINSPPSTSKENLNLSSAQGSISVAGPVNLSYDLKIDYTQSMGERIGSLLSSGMLADVKFLIGEEKVEVLAHKLILALSSLVFTSMFYNTHLESQNVIEIPDCRPEAFQALIRYLYKSEQLLPMDVNDTLSVLYASRKYAVKGLEDICAITLSSSITPENVFDILQASNLHSLPSLEAECWEFIENHTEALLECHLTNMDEDILTVLLRNDRLNIREVLLFEYVLKWIEHECEARVLIPTPQNKMNVGEMVLKLIRFPTMTSTDFADKVVPTGIMKVDEIAKILTYISSSPERKENYSMEYSTKERKSRGQLQSKLQSKMSVSGPMFVTYEVDRNENNNNTTEETTDETRSRRSSRRSRRRNR